MGDGPDLATVVVGIIAAGAAGAATALGGTAVQSVTDLVRARLGAGGGDPAAVGAVQANPGDPAAQARLTGVLDHVFAADPAFRVYLADVVARAQAAPPQPNVTGSIVVDRGARVKGNLALRDVVINRIRHTDNSILAILVTVVIAVLVLVLYGGTRIVTGMDGESPAAEPRMLWDARADSLGTPVGEVGPVVVFEQQPALVARNARDGKVLWTVQDPKDSTGPPCVVDPAGRVIVHLDGGEIRALDAQSGHALWTYRIPHDTPVSTGDGSIRFSGGTVYVAEFDTVSALNADTGAQLWSTSLKDAILGELQVSDRTLLVRNIGVSGKPILHAIDAKTGEKLWNKEFDGSHLPVLSGGTVFLDLGGNVAAVTAADGTERWTDRDSLSDLYVEKDVAVFHDDNGIRARELGTGDQLWTGREDPTSWPPVAAADMLVIRLEGDVVAGIDLRSGAVAWRRAAVAYGSAFGKVVVQDDNRIHALDPATGATRWSIPFTPKEAIDVNAPEPGNHVYLTTLKPDPDSPFANLVVDHLYVVEVPAGGK